MERTPEEIVAETIRISKEYDQKMAELDRQRKEVIATTVHAAEQRGVSKVRAFILGLFNRKQDV